MAMNYLQKTLLPDEKILYYTGPHLIIFAPAFWWFIVSIFLFSSEATLARWHLGGAVSQTLANVALVLTLVYGFMGYVTYISSEYGITNKRVLMKVGFIRRNSLEIFLQKVESVYVKQGIIGRILNYGIIVISGTGGSKDPFPFIPDPLMFRRKVQEQIEKINAATIPNGTTATPIINATRGDND